MTDEGQPEPEALAAYRRAAVPAAATPWRQAAFSVVDLETTGFDPGRDEIISFAAVGVAGGTVRLADAVNGLVRPRRMPSAETIRIHGLRASDLADAPELEVALDGLLGAMTGRILVAHVAVLEEGFLGAALRARGAELRGPIVDTSAMADASGGRTGGSSGDLSGLARSLNLPVHRPHHADGDALTTAQVFIALASHLEADGPVTVGSLQRLSTERRSRSSRGALAGLAERLRRPRD